MRWYAGPWQWNSGDLPHWSPPAGAVGALDLRSVPQQSVGTVQDGYGIFASKDELSSDYELLGTGSLRDVKTSQRLNDRIPKRDRKRQPKGDDLLSLLLDAICDGSDPTGDDFAKPLMPDSDLRLSLNIAGITHQWKTAPWNYHWDKIQDVERADFQRCFDDAKAGRLKDGEHHRRVLDALCDKYNLQGADDWKGFIPAKLRKEIKGRLKHETTITDNFNRANAATLGTSSEGWSWADVVGTRGIVSNRCSGTVAGLARAESDLSSGDQYGQITASSWIAGRGVGPAARFSASTTTAYFYLVQNQATDTGRLFKVVNGTYSVLSARNATAPGLPLVVRCEINGSTLTGYEAGIVTRGPITDTAITGNVRAGLYIDVGVTADDWSAADVAASNVTYTRLETLMRGVTRGVYTRNGG